MAKTATIFFELSATHAYFAGTDSVFAEWAPTAATAEVMRGQRMMFKSRGNQAAVVVELDGDGKPLVPVDAGLALTFTLATTRADVASVMKLPEPWGGGFFFSNDASAGTGGSLHSGAEAGSAAQVRIVGKRFAFDLAATAATHTVSVRPAGGAEVFTQIVERVSGRVSGLAIVRVSGAHEVLLDGVKKELIFADDTLLAVRPLAVVRLVARTGVKAGFELIAASGAVQAPAQKLSVAFGAFSPKWRYVVVPRMIGGMAAADLRISEKTAGQFAFGAASAMTLSDGGQAFVLDSTKRVPLSVTGIRGLVLQRVRSSGAGFDDLLTDLPNPRAESRSADAADTSQVFLYV